MVTSLIIQSMRNRAEEFSSVDREVLVGAVAASLALASALTALVALAELIALV